MAQVRTRPNLILPGRLAISFVKAESTPPWGETCARLTSCESDYAVLAW
jgi:hypothetical protein